MSRKLVATKLMPSTIERLDAAASRLGWSRAATIEVLVNTHADSLDPTTPMTAGMLPMGARSPGQKRGKGISRKTAKSC